MDMTPFILICVLIHISACTTFYPRDHPDNPMRYYDESTGEKELDRDYYSKILLSSTSTFNVTEETPSRHDKWGREIIINPDDSSEAISSPQYPIDCTNERECEEMETMESSVQPTFKPFSQDELNKFLKDYAEKYGQSPDSTTKKLTNMYVDDPLNILESTKEPDVQDKAKKSWHLINSKIHNHPYDDHSGWVTLEPVPWSSSQVQKWEPNPSNRPQFPPWDKPESHWNKPEPSHWNKPESHWNKPEPSHWNKPNKWQDRPWNKPTYEYKPTPKPWPSSGGHQSWSSSNNKPQWQSTWNSNPDIITDGRPGEFPQDSHTHWSTTSYRPHTEVVYQGQKDTHPTSYPSEGNGQWILLSSTKGYSYPHRNRAYQRALNIKTSPTSVSSHRTVRLTVLPAINGTKNTTTSHGGLLEVEQTFQTVDEAQREHAAKMLKLDALNKTEEKPEANRRVGSPVRVYPMRRSDPKSGKAVLAAVGAGMVPATMAMLLPMVLGRKKRSIPRGKFNRAIPNPRKNFKLSMNRNH